MILKKGLVCLIFAGMCLMACSDAGSDESEIYDTIVCQGDGDGETCVCNNDNLGEVVVTYGELFFPNNRVIGGFYAFAQCSTLNGAPHWNAVDNSPPEPGEDGEFRKGTYDSSVTYVYEVDRWLVSSIIFAEYGYVVKICNEGNLDTVIIDEKGNYRMCTHSFDAFYWSVVDNSPPEPGEDGEFRKGTYDSTITYVYDVDQWRVALSKELLLERACTRSMKHVFFTTEYGDVACLVKESYSQWGTPDWSFYEADDFLNDSIEYGSVTDDRDGHVYKTVVIGGKTWMAENFGFKVGDGCESPDAETRGCLYDWADALVYQGERTFDTSFVNSDSVLFIDKKGICMDGWHVPDTLEWKELLESNRAVDFLSVRGWSLGTNATGFSASPNNSYYDNLYNLKVVVGYYIASDYRFFSTELGNPTPSRLRLEGAAALFKDCDEYEKCLAKISALMHWNKQFYSSDKGALRCVKDDE